MSHEYRGQSETSFSGTVDRKKTKPFLELIALLRSRACGKFINLSYFNYEGILRISRRRSYPQNSLDHEQARKFAPACHAGLVKSCQI